MTMDKSKALAAWERIKRWSLSSSGKPYTELTGGDFLDDMNSIEQAITAQPKAGDVEKLKTKIRNQRNQLRSINKSILLYKSKYEANKNDQLYRAKIVEKIAIDKEVKRLNELLTSHGYIVPEGHAVVPLKATNAMLDAGANAGKFHSFGWTFLDAAWPAMIEAHERQHQADGGE